MTRRMKDSGVEWIGEIPEKWEMRRLKTCLRKEKNIVNKHEGQRILSLTMNGVIVRDIANPKGKMPTTFDGYQEIKSGNIIECLFDIDVTPRCVGIARDDGLISPAYTQFKIINSFDTEFVYHYLLLLDNDKIIVPITKSLRNTIKSDDFLNLPFSFPSLEMQKKIVKELKLKMESVDRIISETKESIIELKKYKQSLITETVIKGLDKDVEMKDSEIEWIGCIPKHWTKARVKNLFFLRGRIGWQGLTSKEYQTEGAHLITGTDFNSGKINWATTVRISEERYNEAPEIHVRDNDLLITKDGTIGKVAISKNTPENVSLNSGVMLMRERKNNVVKKKYIYYVLISDVFWRWYGSNDIGSSTIKHLYQGQFQNFSFPLPDAADQKKIIKLLDTKIQIVEELIANKEQIIKEYLCYKKTLIYEYITGKKEVLGGEFVDRK
ncbi:restriction endonuclease subunit S [Carnobacterium sp. FSL E2-0243]|uniref:restriction endonuclease subunit S n=1 Tax=Carnobacterium sp. FSL E2-0243 TaxID=2921365 RepID=UPI0030F50941